MKINDTTYKILKNSILLCSFSMFSIAIIVFINDLTQIKIVHQKEKEKQLLLEQVIPSYVLRNFKKRLYFIQNQFLGDDHKHHLWVLLDSNQKAQAAIIETTAPDGYCGVIKMLVAAYFNGKIIGVRVLSHQETPGIGDKIEISISNWITKFSNMYVSSLKDKNFVLKKYGGSIEQFTGATITPQAVTNSVKRTVVLIKKIPFLLKYLQKRSHEN
ncbi:electron transport complex subunit RsxG [Buchnera aphidicola (Hyadaphis tataricae)]|uniref:Ion-translocating oxidoreductase complex subunit G n=1 Tax=Buchnera aphidicola (Hyadaphis tataricae) TaxID=1241859 RepID=A0A4D6Y4V0_9GAMM|nr:electron transport complex subunit RsxG [Buchnera aphidicola]QCI21434.1 electron transport complex subunit RsxG [Buchnera aphidicola (Hyadaphis tataricae)]